jgi:membrane protease YdiL (CAAX protease family)
MRRRRYVLAIMLLGIAVVEVPAADSDSSEDRGVDPARTLFVNSLLPGTAQITMGQLAQGWALLLSSLTLKIVGNTMLVIEIVNSAAAGGGIGIYRENGRTYLLPPSDDGLLQETWLGNTGMTLAIWGSLLGAYSQYDSYLRLIRPSLGRRDISLGEVLVAPYQARNALSWQVLPVLVLSTLSSLDWDRIREFGEFFRRDEVDFWGLPVRPLTGLALNTLFAFTLVHANAAAEELVYRGMNLRSVGPLRSTVAFGAAHLPNMLTPGMSVEDTLLQTGFATAFGAYAARMTMQDQYDLGKAIDYIARESYEDAGFAWQMSIRY